jgi:DNA-3-methyladenine glycosylase
MHAVEDLPPLERAFYVPSARKVAPALLGQILVASSPEGFTAGVIVETEAYVVGDPACHANRGMTLRNAPMFEAPGHAYVYFIYGTNWCFNAVCGAEGIAEAVLIRAIEPIAGVDLMGVRRPKAVKPRDLGGGPGKLCAAMAIGRAQNRADLCARNEGVWIARRPPSMGRRGSIRVCPRIGIREATDWPLRFYLEKSSCVSVRCR